MCEGEREMMESQRDEGLERLERRRMNVNRGAQE
jgi:hypothetical protein